MGVQWVNVQLRNVKNVTSRILRQFEARNGDTRSSRKLAIPYRSVRGCIVRLGTVRIERIPDTADRFPSVVFVKVRTFVSGLSLVLAGILFPLPFSPRGENAKFVYVT